MSEKRDRDDSLANFPSAAPGQNFPETCWDLVRRCRDGTGEDRRQSLDRLVLLYWKPVYRFYQRALRVPDDEAKDVTQAFFARFLEKDFLKNLQYEKSFRNFLKTACRRFLINQREAEAARRPPDGGKLVSLTDDDGRTAEVAAEDARFAGMIDEEFRAFYLEEALERTRAALAAGGKEIYFEVLRARVGAEGGDAPPSYDDLAARLGLRVFDVRNYLAAARKVFRACLQKLAAERSDDPADELRALGLE